MVTNSNINTYIATVHIKINQLHAVSRTQQGREPSVKTLRSPLAYFPNKSYPVTTSIDIEIPKFKLIK